MITFLFIASMVGLVYGYAMTQDNERIDRRIGMIYLAVSAAVFVGCIIIAYSRA